MLLTSNSEKVGRFSSYYMIDFKMIICYYNHHVIPTPGAPQSLCQYGSDTFPRLFLEL